MELSLSVSIAVTSALHRRRSRRPSRGDPEVMAAARLAHGRGPVSPEVAVGAAHRAAARVEVSDGGRIARQVLSVGSKRPVLSP